jgi:hypothetical protein
VNMWRTAEDLDLGFIDKYNPKTFENVCLKNGHQWSAPKHACLKEYSSCADSSRILLKSEDGKHWCHKVQTGEQQ